MTSQATQAVSAERPWYRARWLRRFFRNRLSLVGLAMVLVVIVAAIFARYLAPYPGDAGPSVHFANTLQPPSLAHLFGTDDVGRDIFSRVIFGARFALLYPVVVLGIALLIGIPTGLIAGYWPHSLVGNLILRLTDVFLAVPPLALALAVTVAFKPSLATAMIAISFTWWPWYTRLIYGETRRVTQEAFVEATEALGQKSLKVMFKHILPNIVSPVVVKATLDVSFVILLGASLSFLGVGAQEPTPDWGAMIARGRLYLPNQWWVSTMPGFAIFITVTGFNLLGDALRDALDVMD